MRRSPSDDLFRLIKSLNKGEKRNFKLLAGQLSGERDKKYLELFDLIDKQDSYNEQKLLKQVGDLYGGQLSVGKHYLYRFILKSLVYYDSSTDSDLHTTREQIRILINKDLYEQAKKKLRKAIRESEEIEDFHTLHTLLGYEKDILLRTQKVKDLGAQIIALNEKRQAALDQLANMQAYEVLASRMYVLMNTRHIPRQPEDIQTFEEIANHHLMGDPSYPMSTTANIHYHTILRKLASCTGDTQQAIYYSEILINTFEKHPTLKERDLREYFREISNLGNYFFRAGRYQEAYQVQQRFQTLMEEYPNAKHELFPHYLILTLAFSIALGRPDQAIPIFEEAKDKMDSYSGKIRRSVEYMIYYLAASMFFMAGRYSDSLRWVHLILNEPKSSVRIDLQCLARLLNLMIHFEMTNYIFVENEVCNVQRFLDRNGFLFEFEKAALKGLRRMAITAGTAAQQQVMVDLKVDIAKIIEENKLETSVDDFLNFSIWIDSHLQGMDLAILQQMAAGIKWSELSKS